MAEVTKQFEVRQLLKAYRKGLISDDLFEQQMREIELGEAPPPPTTAKRYEVGGKTFSSERELLICFLDEFRAGETFGGEVLGLWRDVATNPCVRGGLRTVCEREAAHGRLLGERLAVIGGRPTAELPEKFRQAACARLGSRDIPDVDKVADFNRRIPDADAAVKPIRRVIEQLEHDLESRALLETILDDELATIRWYHEIGKALGAGPPDTPSMGVALGRASERGNGAG